MQKKPVLIASFIWALSLSLLAATQFVDVAEANFFTPPADTVMEIEYPQNATYDTNSIELRFTVETNLGLLYFYSLDGREHREVNTTIVSQVPLPQYPAFIDGTLWTRRTERGLILLTNLAKGAHTVIIYQIYPISPENPQDGRVIASTTVAFNVSAVQPLPEQLSTALVATASAATIAIAYLTLYFKKHGR